MGRGLVALTATTERNVKRNFMFYEIDYLMMIEINNGLASEIVN
jgi:hypothetical protein